jgi:hypothetical protein
MIAMTKNASGTQIHCEITNDSNPKMNHTKSSTTKTKDEKKSTATLMEGGGREEGGTEEETENYKTELTH